MAESLSSQGTRSFQDFFKTEAAGGALLLVCACAALVVANSPWAHAYHALWATTISVGSGDHVLTLTLHQWINDGLMALFFLLVGLEIKREFLAGELSSLRHAALPIVAAIGGVVVPASVFLLVIGSGPESRGWAIAMATDIAFALGALAIVAPRAPSGLKVFLAALAIVDDIAAVLVIALFYTGAIDSHALAMAGVCFLVLFALNRLRVRWLTPYLLVGVVLWFFVHESGIHATVAGVLIALAIPARSTCTAAEFSAAARGLLDEFDRSETGDRMVLTSKGQQDAIFGLARASRIATEPLLRMQHSLHGLSAFVVMPLFAFSNAGVSLGGLSVDRVTLAVFLGLVIGKPLGITAAAVASVRTKISTLPQGVSLSMLHGCSWLGGIGFTMSLFIAALAFEGTPYLDSAKLGILAGSAVAGVVGAVVVRASTARTRGPTVVVNAGASS